MAAQLQLFLRKALIVYPPSKPTADCMGIVEADDGGLYYIKGDAHGRPVRASEWLGAHIAEAVGIQAPAPVAIQLTDGTVVFGSRRIAGVADDLLTRAYLMVPSASNLAAPIAGLATILSKIYALDMFLFNDDRHFGNYLSIDDNGVRRIYTFDFSRAVFWKWPWNGFPVATDNTRMYGGMLRQLHGFDLPAANAILDNLGSLAPATIEGFINQMPANWTTPELRTQLADVWASGHGTARVDALRKGFSDGTLL